MVKERLSPEPRGAVEPLRSILLVDPAVLGAPDIRALGQVGAVAVTLARNGDEREQSRRHARTYLDGMRAVRARPRLFVQVNDLSTGLTDSDLDATMGAGPDGILLPGCRSGADVQHLGTKLAVREAEFGLADGSTRIIAIVGGAPSALFGMETYAGCSPRLAGLAWDADQLASVLGVEVHHRAAEHPAPIRLARTLVIIAAHAAGVPAIDTACRLRGPALVVACTAARRDGFTGKFAVEPRQVPIIEAAFGSAPKSSPGRGPRVRPDG